MVSHWLPGVGPFSSFLLLVCCSKSDGSCKNKKIKKQKGEALWSGRREGKQLRLEEARAKLMLMNSHMFSATPTEEIAKKRRCPTQHSYFLITKFSFYFIDSRSRVVFCLEEFLPHCSLAQRQNPKVWWLSETEHQYERLHLSDLIFFGKNRLRYDLSVLKKNPWNIVQKSQKSRRIIFIFHLPTEARPEGAPESHGLNPPCRCFFFRG